MYLSSPLQSRRLNIADGLPGILETVRVMRSMVDTYKASLPIRGLALSLVEFLPGKDQRGEIEVLFTFVRDKIRYVKDINGIETVSTPDQTLNYGQGDCDDKSVLLACLLESIGYPTVFKITGYSGHEYQHVYVAALLDNELIHMDATENYPMGWEAPNPTVEKYL
jgi:hypothetical protein